MVSQFPAAVIFDNDGVLVDSESLMQDTIKSVFSSVGFDIDAQELAELQGRSLESMRDWVHAAHAVDLPVDFEQRFVDAAEARLRTDVVAVEGVRRVIEHLLACGVAIGVASNGRRSLVMTSLESAGLTDLLDERLIVTIEDVTIGKPAPNVYLLAADRLAVLPELCTAIEDTRAGLTAARSAGMTTIGFAERSGRAALDGADRIVDGADGLLDALRARIA